MANTLVELWLELRNRVLPIPPLRGDAPTWDDDDEPEQPLESKLFYDVPPPLDDLPSIAGVCVEIEYRDAKGRQSGRRVTCRAVELNKGVSYLKAHCHERQALRLFRADRIVEVIDLETGECLSCDEFLAEFRLDAESALGMTWGLGVQRKARLLNAIRVLAFLGRCDKDWHHLEIEEIENFCAVYWMRSELPGEPPIPEMMKAARRMAPLAEDFFVALQHVVQDRAMLKVLRPFLRSVIDADGKITSEELFWGSKLESFLAEASA